MRFFSEDAFVLPSITSTSDFEPRSAPAFASSSRPMGPSLPPELFPDQSDAPSVSNGKCPADNGFSMPPDEPQSTAPRASTAAEKNSGEEDGPYIGPSLPAEFLPSVSSSTVR